MWIHPSRWRTTWSHPDALRDPRIPRPCWSSLGCDRASFFGNLRCTSSRVSRLVCHSFPVQQRLAFILGQIPAQTTANSEDWFCSLRYLNAWNSSFKTNQGDKLDLALLARGKDFVIEILNSPEGQTPMPTWARAKNDLYSSQRIKNGRMLDRAEKTLKIDFLSA